MAGKTFDIESAVPLLREAVRPYPPAAMFQLADEGFTSAFEQLIACIISIRTYDEVSIPVAHRLFSQARSAAEMEKLTAGEISALIAESTFAEPKAHQILAIAQAVVSQYNGTLPCDREIMLSFGGVGPKCAHLALGIACQAPFISVDIHVHRVTNRWGYIQAATPEKTMIALENTLPQPYWIEINRLLVPFGKHICQGRTPRCSICPLFDRCERVGVKSYR